MCDQPSASDAASARSPRPDGALSGALLWLLALLLVAAVIWVGSPALDAPWIQGDEHIFIVNNPDVTGLGPSQPTGWRWLDIFLHAHEDLYQPVTILTYAVEWSLWGEQRISHIRLTDVLIHALNALLLWAVLRGLLRRLYPAGAGVSATVSWALACVWALHPMLVGAYVADMGRTHLLAATFTFLSLLLHLRSLRPGAWGWFVAAYVALLLAMLNKPMVGWVLVVFALEGMLIGLRRTLRSARIYLIGVMCGVFAVLTLWTTKETLLLEDSPLPLFGDPVTRAALGLSIYLRNFLAPFGQLSAWYPPDIRTGWGHPGVWLGLLVTIAAAAVAWSAARRERTRGVTVGLVWFWAMWLPVSGLVGARVLAAQDRYMYQPMIGLLLVIGVGLVYWIQRRQDSERRRALVVVTVALLLGAAALPWDSYLCRHARSTLQRGLRAVKLNPDDPRVMEFLAAAYDFSRDHDTLESHFDDPPSFMEEMARALQQSSDLAELHPHYFGDAHSRAAFHRRLSYAFWTIARHESSLAQAQRAREFEPEAKLTWLRLAHAYRALERWEEALQAYEKLESVMPADARDRGLRAVELADLLLNRFNDPSKALYKYREALALPDLPYDAKRVAILGAARCEVLAGKGSDGYNLALTVLRVEPNNIEAAKVIALYHLRSHDPNQPTSFHLQKAGELCRRMLVQVPTDYECLRQFQNVCALNGNWQDAALAWEQARQYEPENLVFRSYSVWSAACAGIESTGKQAEKLLEDWPDNRYGCLAKMLLSIRAGAYEEALESATRARRGPKLPLAREFVRAEATLRIMIGRQELPPDAVILRAALWAEIGEAARGQELLRGFLDATPDSPRRALAEQILRQELPAETAP